MSRESKPSASHYTIDGQAYVRVTRVLSVLAKPGLLYWYGRHGTDECVRLMRAAQDFGTRFHAAMEQHALGTLLPWEIDGDILPHVEAACAWFDANVVEVVRIERRVHSRRHGFAGTADLIAVIRGYGSRAIACDWKTSKSVAWEYGPQLSAYLEGSREEGHDLGDDRLILWAPREQPGTFEAKPLPREDHADDWALFLHALSIFPIYEARERRAKAEWARNKRSQERAKMATPGSVSA